MIRRISTGSSFERDIGYSRTVVAGDWIFVAGTTGFDYTSMTMPDGVEAQCLAALDTIGSALAKAGAGFADVVRVRYILPDPTDWPLCWPILSRTFGPTPPAATMLSAGLQDPAMRIEIEATAWRPAT